MPGTRPGMTAEIDAAEVENSLVGSASTDTTLHGSDLSFQTAGVIHRPVVSLALGLRLLFPFSLK
jgi:hypothetical protein